MNRHHLPTHGQGEGGGDAGYVLILVAFLSFPLLAIVGLATDVGNWYAEASRMQRAADAASLAGVVWLPDVPKAAQVAREVAAQNGFADGGDIQVNVNAVADTQLRIEIVDSQPDQFFSVLVQGLSADPNFQIVRDSTAEYIKPVPLGSPLSSFGKLTPTGAPYFWAAINGPRSERESGDPFATECTLVSGDAINCASTNNDYRPEAHWFAIEIPPALAATNGTVEVQIYDASWTPGRGPVGAGPYDLSYVPGLEATTRFTQYRIDGTPDHTDNVSAPFTSADPATAGGSDCSLDAAPNAAPPLTDGWVTLCRFFVGPNDAGVWPMLVQTSGPGLGTTGDGFNAFAIRAVSDKATAPRVYAIGAMSVWFDEGGGTSAPVFLGEVTSNHAGKTLTIELFDVGDAADGSNAFITILAPSGAGTAPLMGCEYEAIDADSGTVVLGPTTIPSSSPCRIQTTIAGSPPIKPYNDRWLRVSVDLPTSYTCTACWWKVEYEFPGATQPTDRTTWRVRVTGDPVRVIG